MRELKFNAFDKVGNKMYYDITFDKSYVYSGLDDELADVIPIDDCYILQYTGLNDKNGKEIYEGDIIKITKGKGKFTTGKTVYITDVYFDRCAFRCRWSDNSGSPLEGPVKIVEGYEGCTQDVDIIGNIYETPELLNY